MRNLAILILCLAALLPAVAQDTRVVITAENATSLRMLNAVGSALPGTLAFSPDGATLIATTSDSTMAYWIYDLDTALLFPGRIFSFDADNVFVADGQRWNLDTGVSIGPAASASVVPADAGEPVAIDIVSRGGDTLRVETGLVLHVAKLAVSSDEMVLAVAAIGDPRHGVPPTVYLYRLPDGAPFAILPQGGNGDTFSQLFFTGTRTGEAVVVEISNPYSPGYGAIALYRAEDGTAMSEYAAALTRGLMVRQADMFAYTLDQSTVIYGTGTTLGSLSLPSPSADPVYIAISGNQIAVVAGARLTVATLDASGLVSDVVSLLPNERFYFPPAFYGSRLVAKVGDTYLVWDVAALNTAPMRIPLDNDIVVAERFNADATRYSVMRRDSIDAGMRQMFDAASGALLMEYPGHAVLNPSWSALAYWDGGTIMVVDVATQETTVVNAVPGYLGRVTDVMDDTAAFIGTTLHAIDLTAGTAFAVDAETAPARAQLFDSGRCLVSAKQTRGYAPVVTIHPLRPDAGCASSAFRMGIAIDSWVVTTDGGYLVSYNTACGATMTISGYPTYVYALQAGTEPAQLSIEWGCGSNAVAFAPDGSTVYLTEGVLRRADILLAGDGRIAFGEMQDVLAYGDPSDGLDASIRSVVVSPDGQIIAVTIDTFDDLELLTATAVELFAAADLAEGSTRDELEPLRTIPGADLVRFTPDSRYVVTAVGVYAVASGDAVPEIDCRITAFSPDSRLLATYQDGFVTLWHMPGVGALDVPLAQYEIGSVRELTFSPDGTRLYVVRDGEVQTWGVGE